MKIIVKGLRRCQSEIEEVRARAIAFVSTSIRGEHEVRFNDLHQKDPDVLWVEVETHPCRDEMTHLVTDRFLGLKPLNDTTRLLAIANSLKKEKDANSWDLGTGF